MSFTVNGNAPHRGGINPAPAAAFSARPPAPDGYSPAPAPVGIDPKGAAGAERLPLSAVPWAVVLEMSLGNGEGAVKYGPHNWRESGGVEAATYYAATLRHLTAWYLGEDIDPASGVHHVAKALASLSILRDAQIHGVAVDNRPPPSPPAFLADLSATWTETRARAAAEREAR